MMTMFSGQDLDLGPVLDLDLDLVLDEIQAAGDAAVKPTLKT